MLSAHTRSAYIPIGVIIADVVMKEGSDTYFYPAVIQQTMNQVALML